MRTCWQTASNGIYAVSAGQCPSVLGRREPGLLVEAPDVLVRRLLRRVRVTAGHRVEDRAVLAAQPLRGRGPRRKAFGPLRHVGPDGRAQPAQNGLDDLVAPEHDELEV